MSINVDQLRNLRLALESLETELRERNHDQETKQQELLHAKQMKQQELELKDQEMQLALRMKEREKSLHEQEQEHARRLKREEMEHTRQIKDRELEHAVRMRALELGQPLPDAQITRAQADVFTVRAAGYIGTFVPVAAFVAAGVATALIFRLDQVEAYLLLVYVIWAIAGIVSLVALVASLRALRRRVGPVRSSERPSTAGTAPSTSPVEDKDEFSPKFD